MCDFWLVITVRVVQLTSNYVVTDFIFNISNFHRKPSHLFLNPTFLIMSLEIKNINEFCWRNHRKSGLLMSIGEWLEFNWINHFSKEDFGRNRNLSMWSKSDTWCFDGIFNCCLFPNQFPYPSLWMSTKRYDTDVRIWWQVEPLYQRLRKGPHVIPSTNKGYTSTVIHN